MSTLPVNRGDVEEYGFTPAVVATLGISALHGVGAATLRNLGEPEQALQLFASEDLEKFAAELTARGSQFKPWYERINTWQELRERVWHAGLSMAAELVAADVRCITPSSPLYPERLNDLGTDRPHWLFLRGDISLLGQRSVAVVGTRNPSEVGEFLTRYCINLLLPTKTPVVSGLAKGIDTVAHSWALELDIPTISILGSGILSPYPTRNTELARHIVERGGLIVSEYLPKQEPSGETFVWRNRLQACLADCVVATEWKKSSGTAHTVRFAQRLHRTSISLELAGVAASFDAGRGGQHYVLPTDQEALTASMAEARHAMPPGPQQVQETLF